MTKDQKPANANFVHYILGIADRKVKERALHLIAGEAYSRINRYGMLYTCRVIDDSKTFEPILELARKDASCSCGPGKSRICAHTVVLAYLIARDLEEGDEGEFQGSDQLALPKNVTPIAEKLKQGRGTENKKKSPLKRASPAESVLFLRVSELDNNTHFYRIVNGKPLPCDNRNVNIDDFPKFVRREIYRIIPPWVLARTHRHENMFGKLGGLPLGISSQIGLLLEFDPDHSYEVALLPVRSTGFIRPILSLRSEYDDGEIFYHLESYVMDPDSGAPIETIGLALITDQNRAKLERAAVRFSEEGFPDAPVAEIQLIEWSEYQEALRALLARRMSYPMILNYMDALRRAEVSGLENVRTPLRTGPFYSVSVRPGLKNGKPILEGVVRIAYVDDAKSATRWLKKGFDPAIRVVSFPPTGLTKVFGSYRFALEGDGSGNHAVRTRTKERKLLSKDIPLTYKKRSGEFQIGPRSINAFLDESLPSLAKEKVLIRIDPSLAGYMSAPVKPILFMESIGGGSDWFSAKVEMEGLSPSEAGQILREANEEGDVIVLSDGRWVRADREGIQRLKNSLESLGLAVKKDGSLGKIDRGTWTALNLDMQESTESRSSELLARLEGFSGRRAKAKKEPALPARFLARLRPYQKDGFHFFHRIHRTGTGGILADDMGLGKTVQALGFLVSLQAGKRRVQSLVVAPVAALSVWEHEAARFAPDLPVSLHHGVGRSAEGISSSGVLLTTYGTLLRDIESFQEIEFETVLLDEAQSLKNHLSESARAVRKLNSKSRFALTGTPLENRLADVWSLMDLVFPGLLGHRKAFVASFGRGDEFSLSRLKRRIEPFVLRRLKSEVATELPPLTENNVAIPMTERQMRDYEAVRREALAALKKAGKNALFVMLPYLTRLRRIACHPDLDSPSSDPRDSGKMRHFADIAEELAVGASGVLVFSQFTDVLKMAGRLLDELGLEHHYLDGSTSAVKRKRMSQEFQEGKHPFFLISLKAGGTALTLHRADTVVHLDPWWNPMAERQATDRAHRIGQTKAVMVYRLYSESTVEEKVLALQEKKRELFQALFGGEMRSDRQLGVDEIRELLS